MSKIDVTSPFDGKVVGSVEFNSFEEVEQAIRSTADFGNGFWKIYHTLRKQGYLWNHKKVYRVYKNMHYEKRRNLCKRLQTHKN